MSKSKYRAAADEMSEPEALGGEAFGGEALAMMTGGIVIGGGVGWKFLYQGITVVFGYDDSLR